MNFRTESFDLPQNEQRRCLSCDMAVTQREAHARRATRGEVGIRELTVGSDPVKKDDRGS